MSCIEPVEALMALDPSIIPASNDYLFLMVKTISALLLIFMASQQKMITKSINHTAHLGFLEARI